jgi:hypothetical protein
LNVFDCMMVNARTIYYADSSNAKNNPVINFGVFYFFLLELFDFLLKRCFLNKKYIPKRIKGKCSNLDHSFHKIFGVRTHGTMKRNKR